MSLKMLGLSILFYSARGVLTVRLDDVDGTLADSHMDEGTLADLNESAAEQQLQQQQAAKLGTGNTDLMHTICCWKLIGSPVEEKKKSMPESTSETEDKTWRLAHWSDKTQVIDRTKLEIIQEHKCDIIAEMTVIDGIGKCSAEDLEVKAAHLAHLQSESLGFQDQVMTELNAKYVAKKVSATGSHDAEKTKLLDDNDFQILEDQKAEINIQVGALDQQIGKLQVEKDKAQIDIESKFNLQRQLDTNQIEKDQYEIFHAQEEQLADDEKVERERVNEAYADLRVEGEAEEIKEKQYQEKKNKCKGESCCCRNAEVKGGLAYRVPQNFAFSQCTDVSDYAGGKECVLLDKNHCEYCKRQLCDDVGNCGVTMKQGHICPSVVVNDGDGIEEAQQENAVCADANKGYPMFSKWVAPCHCEEGYCAEWTAQAGAAKAGLRCKQRKECNRIQRQGGTCTRGKCAVETEDDPEKDECIVHTESAQLGEQRRREAPEKQRRKEEEERQRQKEAEEKKAADCAAASFFCW